MKSLRINGILNVIQKCCTIIIPMVTYPYISRVLGPDNYGKFSLSNSIIVIFLLFSMSGLDTYAIREGARIRNNKTQLELFIAEVFTVNLVSLAITEGVFLILLSTSSIFIENKELLVILSCIIPCTVLGRDYINVIFEDYLYTTVRFILVQILGVVLIFTFIKTSSDYILYSLIYTITTSMGYLVNILYSHRIVPIKVKCDISIKRHLVPTMILFLGKLATTIYIQSDVIMLGIYTTDREVGVYSITSQVYLLIKGVINAVTAVCVPRIVFYLGENDFEKYNGLINTLFSYLMIFVLPIMVGVFVFSENIMYIAFGGEYTTGTTSLRIFSISLTFAVLAGFFSNAILITNRCEYSFLVITVISAFFNIILNIVLIPKIGMCGAAVTTLLSEIIVAMLSLLKSRKYFVIKINVRNMLSIIMANCLVTTTSIMCKYIFKNCFFQLFVGTVTGMVTYVGCLVLTENEIVTKCKYQFKQLGGR